MLLRDVLKNVDYKVIKGNIDVNIENIFYNSKNVCKNSAFIALVGYNMDGHKYIDDAIDKGANVIFVEKDIEADRDVTIIKLPDTRRCLALLSANLFGNPANKIKTIGVTGTKGKTTTTWMIKRILEEDNKTVGVIGTMGVFIKDKHYDLVNTTPESYDIHKYMKVMVDNGIEYVVMEVSSQALKLGRVEGITFDYGVFTNLTHDHIGDGEHATMEEYIECKALLFKQCKHGIFNIDDKNLPIDVLTSELQKRTDLLYHIDPYKLEELSQSILKGIYDCQVHHVGKTGDGGIDLIVLDGDEPILVQIKRRQNPNHVELVKNVREFVGTLFIEGKRRGIYISTADKFSKGSKETADKLLRQRKLDYFELIDYQKLCSLIKTSTSSNNIWQTLVEPFYTNPTAHYYDTEDSIQELNSKRYIL